MLLTIVGLVIFTWWFSTGAILWLVQQPPATHRVSFSAYTALTILALMALALLGAGNSYWHAIGAFVCAIVIWGWHEMAFLMGFITGSHKNPWPPQPTNEESGSSNEPTRFVRATESLLYHELALAATVVILFVASLRQPNQVGAEVFFALWVLRLSAKLNLFLGVRNRYASMLPKAVAYFESYFALRNINLLFPISISVGTIATMVLWSAAVNPALDEFSRANATILAMLVTLGVIEHWFLVLPLPFERMWSWAMDKPTTTSLPPHPTSSSQ